MAQHQAVGRERGLHAGERRAGSGARQARVGVDRHGIHPPQVDDDRGPHDRGGAHEAAATAARDQRHALGGGPADGRRQLARIRGLGHREGPDPCRSEVGSSPERTKGIEACRLADRRIGVERERWTCGTQSVQHGPRLTPLPSGGDRGYEQGRAGDGTWARGCVSPSASAMGR